MPKPTQPDAEENTKKKKLEGHQDEEEQTDADDESEEEGSDDGGQGGDDDETESDDADMSDWTPEKVKGYVKNLRKENAKYRKEARSSKTELVNLRKQTTGMQSAVAKALGMEDGGDLTPEQRAEALEGHLGAQQFKTAVLEAAYNHGVPADQRDYFEYLVQKAASNLDEGEELDDEMIEELARKAKGKAKKGGSSTSITKGAGRRGDDSETDEEDEDGSDESDDEPRPSKGNSGKISLDQFVVMTTMQKSDLFAKNPSLYNRLMAEAKRKNLLKPF